MSDLQLRQETLTNYIQTAENRIERGQRDIDHSISENGVFMLNNDQERQQEFMHASDFKVNYKQNLAYISNQRIKLSASSAFCLKMAARFALLFASLQVDTMMYPRLLFSDNMEDKGKETGDRQGVGLCGERSNVPREARYFTERRFEKEKINVYYNAKLIGKLPVCAGGLGTWCSRQAARCACGVEGSLGQRPNVPGAVD